MLYKFIVRVLFCSFIILSPLSAQENEGTKPVFEIRNLQIEVTLVNQNTGHYKLEARFDNQIDRDKLSLHWYRNNQPLKDYYPDPDYLNLRKFDSTEIRLDVSTSSGDLVGTAKKTIYPNKIQLNPISFEVLSSRGKAPLNSRLRITSDLNLLSNFYFEVDNQKKVFKPSFDLIQTEPGSSKIRLVATNKHGITFKSDFVELQAKDYELPTESFQYFSFDYHNQRAIPIVANGEETIDYFQLEEQKFLRKMSEEVKQTVLQPFMPNYMNSKALRLKYVVFKNGESICPIEATYEMADYKGYADIRVEIENCKIPVSQNYKYKNYDKRNYRIYSKGKSKTYSRLGPYIIVENEFQDYLYYDKESDQIQVKKDELERSFRDSVKKARGRGFKFDVLDTRSTERSRLFILNDHIYNIKDTALISHQSLPLKEHRNSHNLQEAEASYPEKFYYRFPDKNSPIVGVRTYNTIIDLKGKTGDIGASTIAPDRDPPLFKLIVDDFGDFSSFIVGNFGRIGFRAKKPDIPEGNFRFKKGVKLNKISSTNYDFLVYDEKNLGIRANEEMVIDDIVFKKNEYISFRNLERLKAGLKTKLNIEGKAILKHINFNFRDFKRAHRSKVYHHSGMSFCGTVKAPFEINPFISLKKDDYFCLYPHAFIGSFDKFKKFDFNRLIFIDSTSIPYKEIFEKLGLKGKDVLHSEQRKPKVLNKFVWANTTKTSTKYFQFDELHIKLAKEYSIFGRKIPPNSVLIFDTSIERAIGYKTPVDIKIEKNTFKKGTRLEFNKKGVFFRALYDDRIIYQKSNNISESLQYLTDKEFYLCSRSGDKIVPAIESEEKVDIQSCKDFGRSFRGMREYGFSINGSYVDKFKINRVEKDQVVLDRVVHIQAGAKHNHRIKAIRSEKVKFRIKISEFSTPTTLLTDQFEYWLPYVSDTRYYRFMSKHTPLDRFYENYCDSRTKKEVNLGWREVKGTIIGINSHMTGKDDLCST